MYLQTGDVLYKSINEIPSGAKKSRGNLIHQGRDHHHLIEGKFELYKLGSEMFIKALGKCKLTHPEHKTLTLDKGVYQKSIVLEYDHFLEESREVID